ncbi:MAG: hypothetical protein NC078_04930 [Ruminococcus sp.]|nr:hypothetical protein [Ruminococcus sp.]
MGISIIDDCDYNSELLRLAEQENAAETVKRIKRKPNIIKLKLQPSELPDIILNRKAQTLSTGLRLKIS